MLLSVPSHFIKFLGSTSYFPVLKPRASCLLSKVFSAELQLSCGALNLDLPIASPDCDLVSFRDS